MVLNQKKSIDSRSHSFSSKSLVSMEGESSLSQSMKREQKQADNPSLFQQMISSSIKKEEKPAITDP